MSRDLNTSPSSCEIDGRWDGPDGPIHVEVKKSSSVRDVRDTFLTFAYLIRDEPTLRQAVCVLVDSRLSVGRLQKELDRFRAVVHPTIADRIHFLVDKCGPQRNVAAFSGSMGSEPSEFYAWLGKLVRTERLRAPRPPLPARQVVIAALAQLRLRNQPPVTLKHLQEICRVSYPTVAAVLKDLTDKGWLEESGERGVRLRLLTTGEWMELARDHVRQRKVHLFTDPTGQSSPEQMVKRLTHLQAARKFSQDVRIGGVVGASRFFPALDISAAPRLDLSVDGDPVQVATLLDAGLSPRTRSEQRVALAVHVTLEPWTTAEQGNETQGSWAGELECLSDLIEMGYTREAIEMACHMESTNQARRDSA